MDANIIFIRIKLLLHNLQKKQSLQGVDHW